MCVHPSSTVEISSDKNLCAHYVPYRKEGVLSASLQYYSEN